MTKFNIFMLIRSHICLLMLNCLINIRANPLGRIKRHADERFRLINLETQTYLKGKLNSPVSKSSYF